MVDKKKLIEVLLIVAALSIIAIVNYKPEQKTAPEDTGADTGTQTPAVSVMQPGSGEAAVKSGDRIQVNYVGTFEDGSVFEASISPEKPYEIVVGESGVKGLDDGVIGMKVGEKRKIVVSPELGYGDQDHGTIPANSTLIYDLTLLKIE